MGAKKINENTYCIRVMETSSDFKNFHSLGKKRPTSSTACSFERLIGFSGIGTSFSFVIFAGVVFFELSIKDFEDQSQENE